MFVSVFSYHQCLTSGKGEVNYILFSVATTTEDDDDDAEDDGDNALPWSALLVSQYELPLTTMTTLMLVRI